MFCCFQREGNSRPKGMDTVRSVKCVVSVHTKTLAVCWCSFSLLSVLICVLFMFGSINHFHSTLYMKQQGPVIVRSVMSEQLFSSLLAMMVNANCDIPGSGVARRARRVMGVV